MFPHLQDMQSMKLVIKQLLLVMQELLFMLSELALKQTFKLYILWQALHTAILYLSYLLSPI